MFKFAILNGKRVAYDETTEFQVQVGKGRSSYRTVATFVGNLPGACIHYQGINVWGGHKKRLYSPNMNKPVLDRVLT